MKNDMKCGTFEGCSNCKQVPDCCSNFNKIDSPVLSMQEVEAIKQSYNINNFYGLKDNGTYCLKTNLKGECIFYLNKGCAIYAQRPADCKLYPYDIIKDGKSYYLILYKLECINEDEFSSTQEVERIMPVVESIIPWISNFTNEDNYKRMNDLPYKVLKKVL